jgi:tRNA threonylcarbamoyladenosine biosynthesis protein TsaE
VSASQITDSCVAALPDANATRAYGRRLGGALKRGDLVCLKGELGAGKTTLARGAIEAWCGAAQEAPSPTYTLVEVYEGARGVLWHVDLYRLASPEHVFELGLEDAFAQAACLVEWPERLPRLPARRLDIELLAAAHGRSVRMAPHGGWSDLLAAF